MSYYALYKLHMPDDTSFAMLLNVMNYIYIYNLCTIVYIMIKLWLHTKLIIYYMYTT